MALLVGAEAEREEAATVKAATVKVTAAVERRHTTFSSSRGSRGPCTYEDYNGCDNGCYTVWGTMLVTGLVVGL